MKRRDFLKCAGAGVALAALPRWARARRPRGRKPNIVFILADDLGYGELGCYGQEKIKTPNIDRLAAEGMRFTDAYAGSTVCAPSRCTLLTGKHTGHAFVRANYELGGWGPDEKEGQLPLPAGTVTLGGLLQEQGYATCAIGKWGLGGPGSTGEPNRQGFDHFYGYLCQRVAHNYYPTHLWRDGRKEMLPGNKWFSSHQKLKEPPADPSAYARFRGKRYAPDLMIDDALRFVRAHKDQPFFLYFATTVPHAALQVPEDSLAQYRGKFDDKPYLGQKSYLPNPEPRATYAAMVSRMDRDIGRLVRLIDELGLGEDTLIVFASDNGPTFNGGTDSKFFHSTGPLRGLKCDLYEGGIRVPLIARWTGHIKPGTTSDHVCAFWDVLPTLVDLTGGTPPADTDGISFLPTLLGRPGQKEHEYLYWEYIGRGGGQAVRMGRWKALRLGLRKNPEAPIQLYDLATDIGETTDVADEHPEIVKRIAHIMKTARTPSKYFPLFPAKAAKPLPPAALIPKDKWRLVRVDSESKFNGKLATNAFDGDPKTIWHTKWRGGADPPPHEIVIDLGQTHRVEGLRYLPRQDGGVNGMIGDFEVYLGPSPDSFGDPVATGRFEAGAFEQEVRFKPASGRYLRLRVLTEAAGRPFTSVAEINLVGK